MFTLSAIANCLKRKLEDIMEEKDFIGERATYDKDAQKIWGVQENGAMQMLLDVRGWGAIQHLFKTEQEAADFQDKLGEWFASAINERLQR